MDPRPAATVVVTRAGKGPGGGVEVLVLRRSERSRFGPGFVVFPGGVVEPRDRSLAERWFGDPAEAVRACALRELAEETGLLPVGGPVDDRSPDGPAHWVVAPGRLPGDGGRPPILAPSSERLAVMARWIAPESLPVRFDATFFAVEAPRGLDPVPDGIEIDRAWWAAPEDVLSSGLRDRLMWPTLKMLEALEGCGSVDEVLRLRVDQVAPPMGGR